MSIEVKKLELPNIPTEAFETPNLFVPELTAVVQLRNREYGSDFVFGEDKNVPGPNQNVIYLLKP